MDSPQPDSGPRKRRLHRKSRLGCLTCKRRHTKCDETQPACTNCTSTGRECRYATPTPTPTTTPPRRGAGSQSPHPPAHDLSTAAATSDWVHHLIPDLVADLSLQPEHFYLLEHMRLWHHVEANMDEWLEVAEPMKPVYRIYVETALSCPYVMDQLLALAALHLSTVRQDTAESYRNHATQLQTRALAGFGRMMEGDAARIDPTAAFAFSAVLSVQVLAERVSQHRHDFGAFLDCIVDYLRHYRGARILADRFWTELQSSELMAALGAGGPHDPRASTGGSENAGDKIEAAAEPFAGLAAMVKVSALNSTSSRVCLDVIKDLGAVNYRFEGPESWGVHVLLGWPNLLDIEFVELLERRVPEALVVLAHFAGYLHRRRDFWVFRDAGERLIQGIANHLGQHWVKWMEEPLDLVLTSSTATN